MATKLVHSVGNLVRAKEDIQVGDAFREAVVKAGTVGIVEATMSRARKRVVCFEGKNHRGDITASVGVGQIAAYA